MPYLPTFYLLVGGDRWTNYLYDTARIVARAELSNGRTLGVVAVSELPTTTADRLMFLAQYQADRLRSGLHFAELHGSCSEAMERFADTVTADANKVEGIPA